MNKSLAADCSSAVLVPEVTREVFAVPPRYSHVTGERRNSIASPLNNCGVVSNSALQLGVFKVVLQRLLPRFFHHKYDGSKTHQTVNSWMF